MSDQKIPVPIAIVSALAEFPVQAAHFFGIDPGPFQRPAGVQPKFLRPAFPTVRPVPEGRFMVSFQQEHVFPFRYGAQETDNLRVFHASVNVVAQEDIKFILLYPALSVQVFPQGSITAMQIADVMDSPVSGQVDLFQPHPFQFIGPDDDDPGRDPLAGQAAGHPLDHRFRHPF